MKVTIETSAYNPRRYGKPWIARVIFSASGEAEYIWGNWVGQDGDSGELIVKANPGDIVARGQKDHLEGELELQIGVNEAQAAVERELRATIAEQSADFERLRNQDLAGNGRYWSTDDSPLLDVALAVIRDEPVPADRIATLIDLARRASA